jgi:hypothetical protein
MEEKKITATRRVNLKKSAFLREIFCCKKIIPPRVVECVAPFPVLLPVL